MFVVLALGWVVVLVLVCLALAGTALLLLLFYVLGGPYW
jgi:hypothetical protein